MKLRIGLLGFGKTGKEVAKAINDNGATQLEWIAVSRERDADESQNELAVAGFAGETAPLLLSSNEVVRTHTRKQRPDAIVDFSVEDNLDFALELATAHRIPYISAVSHYSAPAIAKLRDASHRIPVLWAPNITVGINFLFLAAKAIKMAEPNADVQISEEHFREKQGVSGTALRLADMLGKYPDEINSVRAGGIVGIHEVLFGSQNETLRLKHESISRKAFGDGAIFAAQHIVNKKPGMYTMEDFILPYFTMPLTNTGHIPLLKLGRTPVMDRVRRIFRKR